MVKLSGNIITLHKINIQNLDVNGFLLEREREREREREIASLIPSFKSRA
jgi:hypothetical protein